MCTFQMIDLVSIVGVMCHGDLTEKLKFLYKIHILPGRWEYVGVKEKIKCLTLLTWCELIQLKIILYLYLFSIAYSCLLCRYAYCILCVVTVRLLVVFLFFWEETWIKSRNESEDGCFVLSSHSRVTNMSGSKLTHKSKELSLKKFQDTSAKCIRDH